MKKGVIAIVVFVLVSISMCFAFKAWLFDSTRTNLLPRPQKKEMGISQCRVVCADPDLQEVYYLNKDDEEIVTSILEMAPRKAVKTFPESVFYYKLYMGENHFYFENEYGEEIYGLIDNQPFSINVSLNEMDTLIKVIKQTIGSYVYTD